MKIVNHAIVSFNNLPHCKLIVQGCSYTHRHTAPAHDEQEPRLPATEASFPVACIGVVE